MDKELKFTELPFAILFGEGCKLDTSFDELEIIEYYSEELDGYLKEGEYINNDMFNFKTDEFEKKLATEQCKFIEKSLQKVLKDETIKITLKDWDRTGYYDYINIELIIKGDTYFKCLLFAAGGNLPLKEVLEHVLEFYDPKNKVTQEDLLEYIAEQKANGLMLEYEPTDELKQICMRAGRNDLL